MTTSTYAVLGMTCEHCVRAVTEEIGGIEAVTGVAVELVSGVVTVESTAPVDLDVAAAVAEAGYEVAP
jgi:copper chaperone